MENRSIVTRGLGWDVYLTTNIEKKYISYILIVVVVYLTLSIFHSSRSCAPKNVEFYKPDLSKNFIFFEKEGRVKQKYSG